jgi:polysaccharide deacetylase 2 family uncharacterized protein YibQ
VKTGIFGGFLTGTAVSALVLGGASLVTYPDETPPNAGAVDVPAGSEFRQSREDTQASLPETDDTPGAPSAPQVTAPEPDDLASLQDADTAPSVQPTPGEAESGLTAPSAVDGVSGIAVDGDEPVLPSPQALAPQAPKGGEDLSISTEPAQPIQPEIDDASSAFEPEPDTNEQAALVPSAEDDVSPEVQTEIAEPAPAPEPDAEPELTTEPEVATSESEPQEATSGTIGDLATGVTTGRLPSVGTEEDPEPEPTADNDAAPSGPLTPLELYSVPFENPEGKPLMSFVLIDQGDSPISFDALADFPYPISYAVDANWTGAASAAQGYRAAGLEVLSMIDLPEGASAADTEIAMQGYLSAVPEVVAVMEGVGSGLQSSREVTEQLIPILQESGHGLVLFSEGLDTAQKLIAREGVPALSVFRDIDSSGQSATVIRRFLDQAAFRAGQAENGVIVVGRLRAETVSALLLWGLQDRASSVAIAPVSALLKSQIAQ